MTRLRLSAFTTEIITDVICIGRQKNRMFTIFVSDSALEASIGAVKLLISLLFVHHEAGLLGGFLILLLIFCLFCCIFPTP